MALETDRKFHFPIAAFVGENCVLIFHHRSTAAADNFFSFGRADRVKEV
jgi:hypothetical protein